MKDPTRIPSHMATLQEVWEAQPHLSLPLLLHQLQVAGITATSTDDDLAELLQHQLATHPLFMTDANLTHRAYIVETTSPARRIILSGNSIAVLPLAGSSAYSMHSHPRAQKLAAPINETPPATPGQRTSTGKRAPLPHSSPEVPQPTAWHFSSVRTCRVSYPLVIIGEGSISHHLGVVTSISPASFPAEFADISQGILPWIPLPGTASSDLASSDLTSPSSGEERLFHCTDGTLILLGRRFVVFSIRRRAVSTSASPWSRADIRVTEHAPSSHSLNTTAPLRTDTRYELVIETPQGETYISPALDWAIRTR